MAYLIIAEKPEQASKIAAALKLKRTGLNWSGKFKNEEALLVSAVGHVIDYKEPRELQNYKVSWIDPEKNVPLPKDEEIGLKLTKPKVAKNIISNFKKNKFDKVICATDPDDEGARIFYNICLYAAEKENCKNKKLLAVKLVGSLSSKDINKSFSKIGPFNERLYLRSKIRSMGDWNYQILTAGFTGYINKLTKQSNTPNKFKTKNNSKKSKRKSGFTFDGPLSVGRVQTFILWLIDKRTKEHDNFKEENLYVPTLTMVDPATGEKFQLEINKGKDVNNELFKDKSKAEGLIEKIKDLLKNKKYKMNLNQTENQSHPFVFFNLLDLQKANSNLPPKEVLSIADKIRINGGLTYARTDYRELPQSYKDSAEIKNLIKPQIANNKFKELSEFLLKDDQIERILKTKKLFTSKARQHHGIVTTDTLYIPKDKKEAQVYESVSKNVLFSFAPPALYNTTSAKITFSDAVNPYNEDDKEISFSGTVNRALISKGYLAFVDNKEKHVIQKPISLETIKTWNITDISIEIKATKRPSLYDDNSLMRDLAKCYRINGVKISNDDKKLLEQAEGIGRPSSRANIIEKLVNRNMINKEKKSIRIAEKGELILKHCPPEVYDIYRTVSVIKIMDKFNDIDIDVQKAKKAAEAVILHDKETIERHLMSFKSQNVIKEKTIVQADSKFNNNNMDQQELV